LRWIQVLALNPSIKFCPRRNETDDIVQTRNVKHGIANFHARSTEKRIERTTNRHEAESFAIFELKPLQRLVSALLMRAAISQLWLLRKDDHVN
jgi:hypothetical protein